MPKNNENNGGINEQAGLTAKKTRRKRRFPGETKREAFVRLAEARTGAALEKIRLVGNLAVPRYYEFNGDDIDKIFGAIEDEIRHARSRFDQVLEGPSEFSLDDEAG